MQASELAYEYKRDPKVADVKFNRRIITISGYIQKRERLSDGDILMLLHNQDNVYIHIVFSSKDWSKNIHLKDGDFINVESICYGLVPQNDMDLLIFN